MTTMEDQLECFYLDGSKQNASDMLRTCVQDQSSSFEFNCKEDALKQELPTDIKETTRINDISIQRGMIDNLIGLEGFTGKIFITDEGLGKSSISEGECPEGYKKCPKTGKCIQKCINCVYHENMKSRDFNESDPCFPEGVYNGVTNEGYIKCTCGYNNQYCSNNFIKNEFTTDGMMISGQKIIANVGVTSFIDDLFNIDQL